MTRNASVNCPPSSHPISLLHFSSPFVPRSLSSFSLSLPPPHFSSFYPSISFSFSPSCSSPSCSSSHFPALSKNLKALNYKWNWKGREIQNLNFKEEFRLLCNNWAALLSLVNFLLLLLRNHWITKVEETFMIN